MILLDISSANFPSSGGSIVVTATYEYTWMMGPNDPTCPDWVHIDWGPGTQVGNNRVVEYTITVAANSSDTRYGTVVFSSTDASGSSWTNNFNIIQGTSLATSYPIWKDTYYLAEHHDVFDYSIRTGGVSVYYGKAYCAPGDGGPYVHLNRICQSYLKNTLPDFRNLSDNVVENDGAVGLFSVCDEEGIELANYKFLMDYAGDWSGETGYVMSEPINGHLDPRMKVMYTQYNDESTSVGYEITD